MSRYTVAVRRKTPVRNQQLSPVWRGIGCLLMLIVPLSAWILAAASVQLGRRPGLANPHSALRLPGDPKGLVEHCRTREPFSSPIQGQFNLYAIVAVFVAYTLLEAAVISLRMGDLIPPGRATPVQSTSTRHRRR